MKSSPSLRLTKRHPRKFPFYRWRGRVIYRFKAGWAYVPGHLGKVSWGMWWMHNMAGAQGLYGPGDGTAATSASVTSTNHRTVKLIFAVWELSYVGIAICLCPWTHGNEIYTLTGGRLMIRGQGFDQIDGWGIFSWFRSHLVSELWSVCAHELLIMRSFFIPPLDLFPFAACALNCENLTYLSLFSSTFMLFLQIVNFWCLQGCLLRHLQH